VIDQRKAERFVVGVGAVGLGTWLAIGAPDYSVAALSGIIFGVVVGFMTFRLTFSDCMYVIPIGLCLGGLLGYLAYLDGIYVP